MDLLDVDWEATARKSIEREGKLVSALAKIRGAKTMGEVNQAAGIAREALAVRKEELDKVEICFECEELTGNSSHSEESLYCADCGAGPYCEECAEEHGKSHTTQIE